MDDKSITGDMVLIFYLAWMVAFFIGIMNLIAGIVTFVIIIIVGMMWSFISYIKVLRYSTRVMVTVVVLRNLYKEPDIRWMTVIRKRRIGSLPSSAVMREVNDGLDKYKKYVSEGEKKEKEADKSGEKEGENKKVDKKKDKSKQKDGHLVDISDITSSESKDSIEEKIVEATPEKTTSEGKKKTLGDLMTKLEEVSFTGDIYITELILDNEEWGKIIVISEVPYDKLNEAMISEVSLKGRRATATAVQINLFAVAEIRDIVPIYDKDGYETDEEEECLTLVTIVTDSDFHSEQIVKGMVDKPLRFVDVKMAVEGYYAYKAVDLAKENKQIKEQIEELQFLYDQQTIQSFKLANRMLENFGERKEYEKMMKKREPVNAVKNFVSVKKNTILITLIVILIIMFIVVLLVM